jgi:hypothetical protein
VDIFDVCDVFIVGVVDIFDHVVVAAVVLVVIAALPSHSIWCDLVDVVEAGALLGLGYGWSRV